MAMTEEQAAYARGYASLLADVLDKCVDSHFIRVCIDDCPYSLADFKEAKVSTDTVNMIATELDD